MFITNKSLSRRTVLKGMGVTMALPLLEAMVPARTILAQGAASKKLRFVAIEMVHGAAGSAPIGAQKHLWSPAATGNAFDLSPSSLSSLRTVSRLPDDCQQHRCPQRRGRSPRRKSAAITSARARYS